MNKQLFGISITFLFLSMYANQISYAQQESNTIIEIDTLEIREPEEKKEYSNPTPIPEPSPERLIPQSYIKQFNENGYVITSGSTTSGYVLTISSATISLGVIDHTNVPEELVKISIVSDKPIQHQIVTFQDGPLVTKRNEFIIRTKCDHADNPCTISNAQEWRDEQAYGFGYTVKGSSALDDFQNGQYYRPFADISNTEEPQVIAIGETDPLQNVLTMKLQANFPDSQKQGTYNTNIHIIAIPE